MKIKTFNAKLADLKATKNNPRQIKKKDFEILKKSLREFPEMRELREVVIDENFTILGGHQRVKALEAIGEKDVPVKQVFGLTEEQKREFIIKDNIANGEWDMDILANEWDEEPLEDWGLDVGIKEPVEKIDKPEVEFSEYIDEESNYILLKFETDIDWLNAQSFFNIKPVKCYSTRNDGQITEKMSRIGQGRVLNGAEALKGLTRL